MPRWVAFLRAINLPGRRAKNDELSNIFEDLGYDDVWAFLTSGNVVFQSESRSRARLEDEIATGLEDQLGFPVPVFVRSKSEIARIAASQPLSNQEGILQVAFLKALPAQSELQRALFKSTEDDQLMAGDRELYWLPKTTIAESNLNVRSLERIVGPMTIRTHRSVVRLAAKL